jgi:hypothetical protein
VLVAGKGDIVTANLTITPERQKLVDFTAAGLGNVSEVVVTGPDSPKLDSLDDLSGKQALWARWRSHERWHSGQVGGGAPRPAAAVLFIVR